MANTLEFRESANAAALLKQLPGRRFRPLVGEAELRDIAVIFRQLPSFIYPINSAAELIEQIGGRNATIEIFGVPAKVARLVQGLPAQFFPVASIENLVEKMGERIRQSRGTVNLMKELGRLRPHLPKLQFPVPNRDALLESFASVTSLPVESPNLPARHGRSLDKSKILEWISMNMTSNLFPIRSEADLYFIALRVVPRSSHLPKT